MSGGVMSGDVMSGAVMSGAGRSLGPAAPTGHNVDLAIEKLADPGLDPVFWASPRGGVASAWHGHVPFAHWLVMAMRPNLVVELGTHNGTSYAAFCDAVQQGGLSTRCVAVDTWSGDAQSGFYGEEVYQDLKAFHDGRYGGFSSLLRSTFDDAVAQFADRSIDLLHIDGVHSYEAVRHDFESWLPKLSDGAVVLFHDIAVRTPGFGVWQLWSELRMSHLSFEFAHEYGLGVLVVGANVADPVRRLCTPGEPLHSDRIRQRFAVLADHARVPAHEAIWKELARERDQAVAALQAQSQGRAAAQAELAAQSARARDLEAALAAMQASTLWRLLAPVRALGSVFRS